MENKITVSVFDKEDLSKTLIENYLKDVEIIEKVNKFEEFDEAQLDYSDNNLHIVIVDIAPKQRKLLDDIQRVSSTHKNLKFVLISYDLSTNLIVDALRSGAKDFLPKPLIKKDLISAIEKIQHRTEYEKTKQKVAKIITVYSNKGGLGKTTLAVNLAREIADSAKEKVLLLDLNMHFGDVTAFLDINPSYDMEYYVENLHRINAEFIYSTLKQYKSADFSILADSPYRSPSYNISTENILKLINKLQEFFSYIVIDTNSNIDERNTQIFGMSDLVFFMTVANLPNLRNCARSIEAFCTSVPNLEKKIRIVLNRYLQSEGLGIEDIEEVLQRKVFWKIPNNYFAIMSAINKGVPVNTMNASTNIAKSYRQLAQQISDSLYKQSMAKKFESIFNNE